MKELVILEREFCEIIGFKFVIGESEENDYVQAILKYARKERERM